MLRNKQRKIKRVRAKISGTADRPRLCVYRSGKQIYAQLIDDVKGNTLAAASSLEIKETKTPVQKAGAVGKLLAQKAQEAKIKTVVFDRHGYQYHGQVKALAEGARDEGLKF